MRVPPGSFILSAITGNVLFVSFTVLSKQVISSIIFVWIRSFGCEVMGQKDQNTPTLWLHKAYIFSSWMLCECYNPQWNLYLRDVFKCQGRGENGVEQVTCRVRFLGRGTSALSLVDCETAEKVDNISEPHWPELWNGDCGRICAESCFQSTII